jgi:hypothetical protein
MDEYRDCTKCKHEGTDVCADEDCSTQWHDEHKGCVCFQSPPCSYCVDNHFEEKD